MRILHFFDIRDGDILQHVYDLARAQIKAGHEIGVVCSDAPGSQIAKDTLAQLQPRCQLGVTPIPMSTGIGLSDMAASRDAFRTTKQIQPDIQHSHGLKSGIISRGVGSLMRRSKLAAVTIHSPHSKGLDEQSHQGLLLRLEPQFLRRKRTNGLIFESGYAKKQYEDRFSNLPCPAQVIHHGVCEDDFIDRQIVDSASDFLFVGELKRLEGIDTLIQALGRMKASRPTGALIVGSGPEEKELIGQTERYGLSHQIFFRPPMAHRLAFLKGGCLVVPTRQDAFPRIILEGAAAEMPMILTDGGGIREIVGDIPMPLIKAGDVEALVAQLTAYLDEPRPFLERALDLKQRVAREFTAKRMVDATESFYQSVLSDS